MATRRSLQLALAALLCAAAPAGRAQTPTHWHVGDAAPDIEGVHLGDDLQAVETVLGEPEPAPAGLDDPGGTERTLRYRGGGLLIRLGAHEGVTRIQLRKPAGGALDGVRVGDTLGAVIRLWGEPPAGAGSVGRYPMGRWTVSVRGDMGANKVLGILLSVTPPAPHLPPPSPGDTPSAVVAPAR